MKIKKYLKQKIVLLDDGKLFFAKGHRLFSSSGSKKQQLILRLPVSRLQAIIMHSHLLSRLLRLGIHHLIYDNESGYYCIYNKKCGRFSKKGKLIGKTVNLVGGRPLRIDLYQGLMIYGEYRSNPERDSVAVMAFDGYEHQPLFEVCNVRHIHTVRVKDDKIYFSTGDYEEEAGIWYWDGREIHSLLQGGQQCRAVDFMLAEECIYYGTDTPLEQNYIYKASYDGELTVLQRVSGSVFYMSQQANRYWLATVVEPSEVNTSSYVQLWASDPKDSTKWVLVKEFKKDIWPMKLFQYGQIQFPKIYKENNKEAWFYLQGVRGSGKSVKCLVS